MRYRPEIDGLRAVAVLPVILFHAGVAGFQGGFVGVDVFLVISGYLITSIILHEQASGSFTLARFYERRARRILPALLLVMVVCIPFAWVLMLPHQLKDFGQSLVATTVFLSNVFFFIETDYFNDFSETAPLLHTWSLAVEEQYYLLFPLFFIWLRRRQPNKHLLVVIVLATTSLVGAQWYSHVDAVGNFYLLPFRAWELLVGVAVAIMDSREDRFSPSSNLSAVGLMLILTSVFLIDKSVPFPSIFAVPTVVGTALIIAYADVSNHVGKLLSSKPLVWLGLISYGAYLWHQPALAFIRISAGPHEIDLLAKLIVIAGVIGLATLSHKYVEKPLRSPSIRMSVLLPSFAFVSLTLMALGLTIHYKQGFIAYKLSQISQDQRRIVIDREVVIARRDTVWEPILKTAQANFTSRKNGSKVKVLLVGDSKSSDLFVALNIEPRRFVDWETSRFELDDPCMGLMSTRLNAADTTTSDRQCDWPVERLASSSNLRESDVVVLAAAWQLSSYSGAAALARSLAASGKKVVVISSGDFQDLTSLSMYIARNELGLDARQAYLYQNIRHDRQRVSDRLRTELAGTTNIRFVEKLDAFCSFEKEACELFAQNGEAYIYDDSGHLTVEGARYLAGKIEQLEWLQ